MAQAFFCSGTSRSGKNRHGFTLVELGMVLGVIGIFIAAIWVAYSSVNQSNLTNQAIDELQGVVQNIINLRQGQSFSEAAMTDITPNMITAGLIPSTYVASATAAANPWTPYASGGGALGVYVETATSFTVRFFGVPVDGCIALVIQAMSCQAGQRGCPIYVRGGLYGAGGTAPPVIVLTPDPVQGWSQPIVSGGANATPSSAANTMCSSNYAAGLLDTVRVDYGL